MVYYLYIQYSTAPNRNWLYRLVDSCYIAEVCTLSSRVTENPYKEDTGLFCAVPESTFMYSQLDCFSIPVLQCLYTPDVLVIPTMSATQVQLIYVQYLRVPDCTVF